MKFSRYLSVLAVGLAAVLAPASNLWAQTAPGKTVSIIYPFPPGGPADGILRLMAQKLKDGLGQNVIVEHKPGAVGAVANNYTRRQPPDGSTIAVVATNYSVAPATNPAVHNYDPATDFTPIARMSGITAVLVASSQAPFSTVEEMIAFARANPGKLNLATAGSGANNHMFGIQLAQAAKFEPNYIHFKGSAEETQAVMGGTVHLAILGLGAGRSAAASGRAKMIAVTTARSSLIPELRPISDILPGLEMTSYLGLIGPPGMPKALTERLSAMVAAILKAPDMQPVLSQAGQIEAYLDSAGFARYVTEDLRQKREVIRIGGINTAN